MQEAMNSVAVVDLGPTGLVSGKELHVIGLEVKG